MKPTTVYPDVGQIALSGDYAYVAISLTGIVMKINATTMQTVAAIHTPFTNVMAVACDGDYVYAAGDANPATVCKYDCDTLTLKATYTDGSERAGVLRMYPDGAGKLYVLTADNPAQIIRLATSNMHYEAGWLDSLYTTNGVQDFTILGSSLYTAAYEDNPSAVVQEISTTSMESTNSWQGETGENNAYRITNDGTYLYIGLDIAVATAIKINPTTMTTVGKWEGTTGQEFAMGIAVTGGSVFVGTESPPFQVIEIDAATMETVTTYSGQAGQRACYNVETDGTYLYVGYTSASPAKGGVDRLNLQLVKQNAWPQADFYIETLEAN